jgi:hypothetical protein
MKNLLLTACILFLSVSTVHAQEAETTKVEKEKQTKISFKIKEHSKADIYVDGKKFDFDIALLDQTKIASVAVIKGAQALKDYNAPNGVLLIETIKSGDSNEASSLFATKNIDEQPLVIIDGTVSTQAMLKDLSPADIEHIIIWKGKKAIEKYNAPNGVVDITTKKGKKNKK